MSNKLSIPLIIFNTKFALNELASYFGLEYTTLRSIRMRLTPFIGSDLIRLTGSEVPKDVAVLYHLGGGDTDRWC